MKLIRGTGRAMVMTRIGAVVMVGGLLLSGCAASTSDTDETGPPEATATQDESPTAPAEESAVEEPTVDEVDAEETEGEGTEDADEGPAPATAIVTLEGESFTFSPSTCMIMPENLLVEAGGKNDATGDLAFLSIDLSLGAETTGEIRVELGTNNAFETTDDFYAASFGTGDEESIDAAFPQATLTGTFRENGEEIIGAGSIDVRCG